MTNRRRSSRVPIRWILPILGSVAWAFPSDGRADIVSETPVWTVSGTPGTILGRFLGEIPDVDGDRVREVVLGVPSADPEGAGEVRVYRGGYRLGALPAWTMHAPGGGPIGRSFGRAVSGCDVDGDGFGDLLVGASGDGLTTLGRVYGYRGGPNGLGREPTWTWSSGQPGDAFGHALVAIESDDPGERGAVLVGAPGATTSVGRVGAVYWAGVTAASVAAAGGARGAARATGLAGAPDGTPVLVPLLWGSEPWGAFGASIDVSTHADARSSGWAGTHREGGTHHRILVGSPDADVGFAQSGRAELFRWTPEGVSGAEDPPEKIWEASGPCSYAYFGHSVSLWCDPRAFHAWCAMAVGAWGASGAYTSEGAVDVFRIVEAVSAVEPVTRILGGAISASLGVSVDLQDFDRDHRPELLAGAFGDGTVAPWAGSATLFQLPWRGGGEGSAGSGPGEPRVVWVRHGDAAGAALGQAVAACRDATGDGRADVLVGSPHDPHGGPGAGRAELFQGCGSEVPRWPRTGPGVGLCAYPNPCTDVLRIRVVWPAEATLGEGAGLDMREPVEIFDATGRRIASVPTVQVGTGSDVYAEGVWNLGDAHATHLREGAGGVYWLALRTSRGVLRSRIAVVP